MVSHPPICSKLWTEDERLSLISWIAGITLDRIRRDDPNMPFVAKQKIFDLMETIDFVSSRSASFLEANRVALEKPYDSSRDYHGMLIVDRARV